MKVYNLVKERVSEKQSNPGREKIKCGNGLMAQISPNKVDFQRVPENKRNKQLMFKEPTVARVVLPFFQTLSNAGQLLMLYNTHLCLIQKTCKGSYPNPSTNVNP